MSSGQIKGWPCIISASWLYRPTKLERYDFAREGCQRVPMNVVSVLSAMWEKVLSIQDCKRRNIFFFFFFFLVPMSPEESHGDFEYINCVPYSQLLWNKQRGLSLSLTACRKGAVRLWHLPQTHLQTEHAHTARQLLPVIRFHLLFYQLTLKTLTMLPSSKWVLWPEEAISPISILLIPKLQQLLRCGRPNHKRFWRGCWKWTALVWPDVGADIVYLSTSTRVTVLFLVEGNQHPKHTGWKY